MKQRVARLPWIVTETKRHRLGFLILVVDQFESTNLEAPPMQRGMASSALAPSGYLRWSAAWAIAAAIVVVAFLFFPVLD